MNDRALAVIENAESSQPEAPFPIITKRRFGIVYWLRWIGFLPAAFAAFFVAQILNALFSWYLPDILMQAINSWVGCAAFVYAGALTAPSHRFHAAIGLSILMCAILISIDALYALEVRQFSWHFAWLLICLVISLIATIQACMTFLEEQHREELHDKYRIIDAPENALPWAKGKQ